MKDKLKTLILPVLFYIVLFAANLYFLKSYYAFSSESIQLVKNALVSSGLNESQSFSIASSISGRVENTLAQEYDVSKKEDTKIEKAIGEKLLVKKN